MSTRKTETLSITVGGETITFETGKIATHANGAVWVRVGDTVVFSAACASKEAKADIDFLPLTVTYQERFSAAGKTLSGFIKREGRPTEKDTLVSRLIDRPIRPLFPEGWFHETQITTTVWSYDGVNAPDVVGLLASSAALVISDVPFSKAVGAVRVGRIDNQFVINPTVKQQEESDLDLVLAGTQEAILMIEGYCDFLTEEQVIEAIELGHESIRTICTALEKWREEIGKPKNTGTLDVLDREIIKAVSDIGSPLIAEALTLPDKAQQSVAFDAAFEKVTEALCPESGEEEPSFTRRDVGRAFKSVKAQVMRKAVLDSQRRADGRGPTDIRPIDIETSILPRTHGSSLFTRGETQAVGVCTLGGESMGQRYEDLDGDHRRTFYMQYSFPPYSVGETGRSGPPGRREIGHGKLAERALLQIVPKKEDFVYTIRLESNITESNGSSSMATVCGGCLSMMDAGVPIQKPIAGIAMGLILEEDRHMILSDILGMEDALGDMDFKVAGNADGVTAFQMDIKVEGITPEIMRAALEQAKQGRTHILAKMLDACPKPSANLSKYAPRIESLRIKPSKIATVIGPGGKQIRAIIDETGVEIDINDDGVVNISAVNEESINHAKSIIEGLVAEVEIGRTYDGKVAAIVPFGLFVEILPGKEGLCHISEVDHSRIEKLDGLYKQGDSIQVKVLDINERGQLKLSRKALLPRQE